MKNFDRLNRRTHLYLGLLLLPWFVMYGASSFVVNHGFFRESPQPAWVNAVERPLDHPVPEKLTPHELRGVGAEILQKAGEEGAFWIQRPKPDELRIDRFSFLNQKRLTYFISQKKIRSEEQSLRWDQTLLRLHFRGGFEQPGALNTLWSVLVDVVCLSIVAWIVTGLVMWWRLRALRTWGALALAGGAVSFAILVATL